MKGPNPVIAVVGPTATGKTDLAVALAHALGGPEAAQIVNADAFQFYRGMDIGTAKPTLAERRGIRHHQIDVLDVTQDSSVARYQEAARADIAAIQGAGATAILVGGSGLYVRAALDVLDFPGTDPRIRADLEQQAASIGPRGMYEKLQAADPQAAANIGPTNTRRLVRALEVIALTGRPYSATLPQMRYALDAVQVGLDYGREELDQRVARRVDKMWDSGLVAEVEALAGPDLDGLGVTAARAVGYAEVLAALRGQTTLEEAREATVIHTRRLARKQMGWFGRDPRVTWLRADELDLAAQVDQVLRVVEAHRAAVVDGQPEPSATSRRLGS